MGELFSTFGINVKLLIIQMVNFGILLLALWYFLYTPILKMIDERRRKIEKGVKDAEEAEKRLGDIELERDGIFTEARKQADSIVGEAKERAVEKEKEMLTEAEHRALATERAAEERALETQAKALRESNAQIAQAAMLAAEKILRNK